MNKSLKVECSGCGYDKCKAALDIHHIKENGVRNGKTMILCSNCHREHHFKKKDFGRKKMRFTKSKRISYNYKRRLKSGCYCCKKGFKRGSIINLIGRCKVCSDCFLIFSKYYCDLDLSNFRYATKEYFFKKWIIEKWSKREVRT